MANPFNPQKPQDSALNAVMMGAMGTGKKSNTIITFDAANQNISNGADVPPENLIKAYNGNSLRTQIVNNEGRIITTTGSQFGFFSSSEDLLAVGNGSTWKMSWEMDFATTEPGTSFQAPYILDSDIIAPATAGFRSEAILIMNMEQDGTTVKFYHKNLAGSFVAFHQGINIYTPEGTRIVCSIARRALDFNMVFDVGNVISKQEQSVLIANTFAHTKNRFAFGDITNNAFFGTLNINNITYPNAA